MSEIPLPPHSPYEEDDAETQQAAYEAQVWLAWNDALEWAQKGAWPELSTLLRSSMPLEHQEVRNFLADILEGKIKRPKGHPVKRPKYTFFYAGRPPESADAFDPSQLKWVDERDLRVLETKKWLQDNEHLYSSEDALVAAAADHFRVHETTIRNAKNRSQRAPLRSRTKPPV